MSFLKSARSVAGRAKRFLLMKRICAKVPHQEILRFTCNICSQRVAYPKRSIARELPSCYYCGSSARMRSIIHALSMELFNESLAIAEFPVRPDIRGLGMSDWEGYACRLETKLAYTNTFYHQAPFLDISSPLDSSFGQFDFVICSEVFEHIAQPVSRAFENARRLLKPNGVMIFSVPYLPGTTSEHFPELSKYTVTKNGSGWTLENTTADGKHQLFDELTFHGGPGSVLEMRVFGEDSLKQNFLEADFAPPRIHCEEREQFGIVWNPYISEEAPYRPLILGLGVPPWAVYPRA